MSDQKKWFKLWHSALTDDELMSLPPALRWAWAGLGAHTKVHGSKGEVTLSIENKPLLAALGVEKDDMIDVLKMLPHVHIKDAENRHGRITVKWSNWIKFQEDSTQAERAKTSRSKKRGEERRGEEKRNKNIPEDQAQIGTELLNLKTDQPQIKINRPGNISPWQKMIDHIFLSWQGKKKAPYHKKGSDMQQLKVITRTYQEAGVMALWDLAIFRLWSVSSASERDKRNALWWEDRGKDVTTFCGFTNFLIDDPTYQSRKARHMNDLMSGVKPVELPNPGLKTVKEIAERKEGRDWCETCKGWSVILSEGRPYCILCKRAYRPKIA